MSQTDLAKELGVGDSTISMYINSPANVGWDKIPKLVDLGITIEELFGEETSKKIKDKIIADYLSSGLHNKNMNFTEEQAAEIVRVGIYKLIGKKE